MRRLSEITLWFMSCGRNRCKQINSSPENGAKMNETQTAPIQVIGSIQALISFLYTTDRWSIWIRAVSCAPEVLEQWTNTEQQ